MSNRVTRKPKVLQITSGGRGSARFSKPKADINVRFLTPDDKLHIAKAAELQGVSINKFIVDASLAAALKAVPSPVQA